MKEAAPNSYSHLLEIVAGLGILVAANILWWPDIPAFVGISPHPYWLLILPLSVYYGFKEGALAALVCAGVYLGWSWFTSPNTHWLVFFTFDHMARPVAFMGIGMMLGELRERHRRNELGLKRRVAELEVVLNDLSAKQITLTEANRELEVRILSQDQTVQTLYQAAEGLKDLDEVSVYPAITDILVNYLGVQAASVYIIEEGSFIRAAVAGDVTAKMTPRTVSNREGLMSGSLTSRSVATVRTILSSSEIDGFDDYPILISAPLILEGGEVAGIVNVHRLPFLRFTPATVRMVGLLADWASIAISNARRHKEVADKNISDELTGAYTSEYLTKRITEEFSRAKRYKMDLSVIMAKVIDFDQIEKSLKLDVLAVLGNVFADAVRDSDMVFRYEDNDTFVLILAATPLAGCQIVINRMLKELNAFQFRPYQDPERLLVMIAGASEVEDDMLDPDDLLALAKSRMEG